MTSPPKRLWRQRMAGFTLVEVLVALFIMSLLALLSWRALDGMTRAQDQVFGHSDQTLALQAGLAQWSADLDALQETGLYNAVDFDGRVLRITRRAPANAQGQLQVVAWALLGGPQGLMWQRWASAPLSTRGELRQAWQRAGDWTQASDPAASGADGQSAAVAPASAWQLFYYRNNAWTNPLSSAQATGETVGAVIAQSDQLQAPPDGVRLMLTLAGDGLQGPIVRDWIDPTVGGTP